MVDVLTERGHEVVAFSSREAQCRRANDDRSLPVVGGADRVRVSRTGCERCVERVSLGGLHVEAGSVGPG